MKKIPVIIDTELTADDIFAIISAHKSGRFDIKAITPAGADNADTMSAVKRFCAFYGMQCRIGQGSQKPLFDSEFDTRDVYGDKREFEPFLPCCEASETEYVWDVVKDEAVKACGELEIITMGPLTNIAITLLRYPEIKPLIKRIVCMAGSGYTGNVLPYSEYNACSDPYALQVVFNSGVSVVMCGLDGVESCALNTAELNTIKADNKLEKALIEHFSKTAQQSETQSVCINSAVAVAYMLDETVGTVQDYYVAVETHSADNKGWTVVDRLGKYKKQPNVKVMTNSSKEKFLGVFQHK